LRDSFNRMAARLAETDGENRSLNDQLLSLQEQERCDLARDLHDEVSPFLFAISVDAATACHLLEEGRAIEARDNVQSIADAVRHMQRQVRSMLGRLRPIGLAEFGLREAIETWSCSGVVAAQKSAIRSWSLRNAKISESWWERRSAVSFRKP